MSLSLTPAQVQKIRGQKHVFEAVQKLTGVPWQAIAAVWSRESLSVAPPKRPGGPFQFDPPLTLATMEYLINHYVITPITPELRQELLTGGIDRFQTAAFFAACWLRHKCKFKLSPDSPLDHVKDAFWGYNGRAFGSADRSFYVMNGFDDHHMNMHILGTVPDGHGGRIHVDNTDHRPGALTVYKQLKDQKV